VSYKSGRNRRVPGHFPVDLFAQADAFRKQAEGDQEFNKTLETLVALRPAIAALAQETYDAWDEDNTDVYAGGGICHLIADEIADALWEAGIPARTISSNFEQHVYILAQLATGVYEVDVHHSLYETGGGFCWKKLPDVKFYPEDVTISQLSHDPEDPDYIEDEP